MTVFRVFFSIAQVSTNVVLHGVGIQSVNLRLTDGPRTRQLHISFLPSVYGLNPRAHACRTAHAPANPAPAAPAPANPAPANPAPADPAPANPVQGTDEEVERGCLQCCRRY